MTRKQNASPEKETMPTSYLPLSLPPPLSFPPTLPPPSLLPHNLVSHKSKLALSHRETIFTPSPVPTIPL